MNMLRRLSALWGVVGIMLLLGYATYRMAGHTLTALSTDLSVLQWTLMLANVLFMAYSEGYKGFQKNFSPRVAARALHLSREAGVVNGLLAPFFCLGYFGTTRKRQISVVLLTLMIVFFVVVVSRFDQPWRGIVDAGVVVGLFWGMVSLLIFCWQAYSRENFEYSPELS